VPARKKHKQDPQKLILHIRSKSL